MFNYTCLNGRSENDFIDNVSRLDCIFWRERPILSHLLFFSLEHSRRFSYQRRLRHAYNSSRWSYKERERESYKNIWSLWLFSQGGPRKLSLVRVQLSDSGVATNADPPLNPSPPRLLAETPPEKKKLSSMSLDSKVSTFCGLRTISLRWPQNLVPWPSSVTQGKTSFFLDVSCPCTFPLLPLRPSLK